MPHRAVNSTIIQLIKYRDIVNFTVKEWDSSIKYFKVWAISDSSILSKYKYLTEWECEIFHLSFIKYIIYVYFMFSFMYLSICFCICVFVFLCLCIFICSFVFVQLYIMIGAKEVKVFKEVNRSDVLWRFACGVASHVALKWNNFSNCGKELRVCASQ